MKRFAIILGAVFWCSAPCVVAAADLGPPYVKALPPPFSWTGFYFGPQAGFGWAVQQNVSGINMNGGLVGGQVGYNFQTGNFVFGIEADAASAYIDKTIYDTSFTINVPVSLRARFGITATNDLILYGTAGGAAGHGVVSETLAGVARSGDAWHIGWAAGAGVEWAFVPNWSAKVEYLHYGLDSATYFGAVTTGNININIVKIGLNYSLH
jgi:outer membrane immunogenic protein